MNLTPKHILDRWITRAAAGDLLLEHKFSCVMAPAPSDLADAVRAWGKMFVPEDVLYADPKDPQDFGREQDIHVTVKFGLHEMTPSEELLRILEETPPFEIEIGPCTLFDTDEKYDVVKFDVDSDALRSLNARISELANSDSHPEYHPHMTVAYVIKGSCNELIGKPLLDPEYEPALRFLAKTVTFSGKNNTVTTLFLGKPNLEPEAEPVQESLKDRLSRLLPRVDFSAEDGWVSDGYYALEWEWWGQDCIEDAVRRGRIETTTDYELLDDNEKEKIFQTELRYRLPALSTNKQPVKIWFETRDDGPPRYDAVSFILWKLDKPGQKLKPAQESLDDDDDEEAMDIETAKEVYHLDPGFKNFTDADVEAHGAIPGAGSLYADRTELIHAPTAWQKQGLCQTASGYGAKLNSGYKISFNGKVYRIYVTCYGNAGSSWFKVRGRQIFVN
jgi:hypothetical protein